MSAPFRFVGVGGDAGVITGALDITFEPEQSKMRAKVLPDEGPEASYSVVVTDLASKTKWRLASGLELAEAKSAILAAMLMSAAGHPVILSEEVADSYMSIRRELSEEGIE